MLLQHAMQTAIEAVFGLGQDIVRAGTYVRPASFNSETGLTAAEEIRAPINFVAGRPRFADFDFPALSYELAHVRASELSGISSPAPSDYIVETSNFIRRDIVRAELDDTGQLWSFRTLRVPSDDRGGLQLLTLSEDFGLVTDAPLAFEDYLTI